MSRQLGFDFRTAYAAEIAGLSDLVADGLLRHTPSGIEVTPAGVPLLRVIAMRFDATFAAGQTGHSRTI